MPSGNIGENLRACRRWRGMTQQVLADRSGLSQSFISLVEAGRRTLARRSDAIALAEALRVSVVDLTGQPYEPVDHAQSEIHAAVPAIRLALMSTGLDESPDHASDRPLAQLQETTTEVCRLRQRCDYLEMGRLLPDLLIDLHGAVQHANDRATALRTLATAAHTASMMAKHLGHHDLAYLAAQRGRQAAELLDDPVWVAAADFPLAHALFAVGAYDRGRRIAARAADLVADRLADPKAQQVYGMMRLTEGFALTATRRIGDTADYLTEAGQIAERTGEGNAFWFAFGPTNVMVWAVSMAVEAGAYARAVEIGRNVRVDRIVKSRQSSFWTDIGRSLAHLRGQEQQAIRILRRAEELGAQRVRTNPFVRETIASMLRRAQRDAGGRELRGLAYRVGIAH